MAGDGGKRKRGRDAALDPPVPHAGSNLDTNAKRSRSAGAQQSSSCALLPAAPQAPCANSNTAAAHQAPQDAIFSCEEPGKVLLFSNGRERASCKPRQHLEHMQSQFLLGAADSGDAGVADMARRVGFELCCDKGLEELVASVTRVQPSVLQVDCPDERGRLVLGKDKVSPEVLVERLTASASSSTRLRVLVLNHSATVIHAGQLGEAVRVVVLPSSAREVESIVEDSKHLYRHMGMNRALDEMVMKDSSAGWPTLQLVTRSPASMYTWKLSPKAREAQAPASPCSDDRAGPVLPWKAPRDTASFRAFMDDVKARGSASIASILHKMREQVDNAEVQEAGCEALQLLVQGSLEAMDKTVEEGGIEAVSTAMTRHAAAVNVLIAGNKALATFCNSCDVNGLRIRDAGGIDAVVAGMKAFKDVAGVQVTACDMIFNILIDVGDDGPLVEPEVFHLVLELLTSYKDDLHVLPAAIRALSVNADRGGSLGDDSKDMEALETVVECMKRHKDSYEVQEEGFEALAWIGIRTDVLSGVKRITEAIVRNADNAKMQAAGYDALTQMYQIKYDEFITAIPDCGVVETILKTFEVHRNDARTMGAACSVLQVCAESVQTSVKIYEQGAGKTVLEAVKKHQDNQELCFDGLILLRKLVKHVGPEAKLMAVEGGVVETLVQLMRKPGWIRYGGDRSKSLKFMLLLADGSESVQRRLIEAGGVEVLVTTISQQLEDNFNIDSFPACGCKLLGVLATSDDRLSERFRQEKGIDVLVLTINMAKDPAAQKAACKALLRLSCRNLKNHHAIRALGGIEAIVKAMEQQKSKLAMHRLGCEAIWRFAKDDEESRERIRKAVGVSALMESIKVAHKHGQTLRYALEVLTMLMEDDGDCSEEIAQKLRQEDLQTALKLHMKDLPMIHAVMGFLGKLAEVAPRNLLLIKEGGWLVDYLRKVMEYNGEDCEVQVAGMEILQAKIHVDEVRNSMCLKAGMKAVVTAMTRLADRPEVVEVGLKTLITIALKHQELRHMLRDIGGIEAVLKVLREHATSILVQEAGCNALLALMQDNEINRTRVKEGGGIDAVIAAMRMFASDAVLVTAGCDALGWLGWEDAHSQGEIRERGGINAVMRAMKTFKMYPRVQEAGCRALGRLGRRNRVSQAKIREDGGIELVVEAMQTHHMSLLLHNVGCRALQYLAENNEESCSKLRELAKKVSTS